MKHHFAELPTTQHSHSSTEYSLEPGARLHIISAWYTVHCTVWYTDSELSGLDYPAYSVCLALFLPLTLVSIQNLLSAKS